MAEDALSYEDLVRLTHVDSHGESLTLEEEAVIEEELVGMHSPVLEEYSATNWAQVANEAAIAASRNVHKMQLDDNILVRWAFMVGRDLEDEARVELEFLESHSYIVETVRPYLDVKDEESRQMVMLVLWWVNVIVLMLAWYLVFLFVSRTLGFVLPLGRHSKEEYYKKSAANLTQSMRMLIDKQSTEMASITREKQQLEDKVTVLEEELDRIVAAIENSSGNTSSLASSQLITSSRLRIDARARQGRAATAGSTPGWVLPQRPAAGPLRRKREQYSGVRATGGDSDSGNMGLASNSIASPSLANTIAANAALLSGKPKPQPRYRGLRGLLDRLASAIPETDEHPVVGFMPSPTPRARPSAVAG